MLHRFTWLQGTTLAMILITGATSVALASSIPPIEVEVGAAGGMPILTVGRWPTYPVAHICLPLADVGLCRLSTERIGSLFQTPQSRSAGRKKKAQCFSTG